MPLPILLLLTTHTYRAAAFLRAAERLGLPVVVASDHPLVWDSTQAPGLLATDFARPEVVAQQVSQAAAPGYAAVIAAEDEGVLAAAAASARLQLRHNTFASVAITRDKAELRRRLAQAGLDLNPPYWTFPLEADPEDVATQVAYPCVLKPRSLSGSRGVIRANDPAEFVNAFRRTRQIVQSGSPEDSGEASATLLVEGYLPGSEHALEGLLMDGRLRKLALFDKPEPLEGPYFEETLYVTPSRLGQTAQEAISSSVAQALSAIGLAHGPVHAEVRVHEEQVRILEIAARSIGGLCSKALRFVGGRSLEEILLAHAAGLPLPELQLEPAASGVMMIPIPGAGTLDRVEGVEAAVAVEGISEVVISMHRGERVEPLPEGSSYLGFLFAEGETPEWVEASLRKAHACLKIILLPLASQEGSSEYNQVS